MTTEKAEILSRLFILQNRIRTAQPIDAETQQEVLLELIELLLEVVNSENCRV